MFIIPQLARVTHARDGAVGIAGDSGDAREVRRARGRGVGLPLPPVEVSPATVRSGSKECWQ